MVQPEIILLILFLAFIVLYLPIKYGYFKKYVKRKKTYIKPNVSIVMSSFLGFFFLIVTVWTALIGFTEWAIPFGLIMCYWFWKLYVVVKHRK